MLAQSPTKQCQTLARLSGYASLAVAKGMILRRRIVAMCVALNCAKNAPFRCLRWKDSRVRFTAASAICAARRRERLILSSTKTVTVVAAVSLVRRNSKIHERAIPGTSANTIRNICRRHESPVYVALFRCSANRGQLQRKSASCALAYLSVVEHSEKRVLSIHVADAKPPRLRVPSAGPKKNPIRAKTVIKILTALLCYRSARKGFLLQ